jgi:phosphoglycerate dehydrogenase-like enzyme
MTNRILFSLFLCVYLIFGNSYWLHAETNDSVEQLITQFQLRENKVSSRDMHGWKNPNKIVLWGNQTQLEIFQKNFPDIEFFASTDINKVADELKDADVFVGYCIPDLLSQKLNVSWIQSLAVGVENCVNAKSVKNSNVIVTNTQRLSAPEIAEHAIGMMFSLVRRLDQYSQNQVKSKWDGRLAAGTDKVWEIEGRTMLVVGLGGIGTETAKRAHGLGMKVLATRNSSRSGPDFVNYVGLPNELFDLAAKADIIVNTVPLTDKTNGMFDLEFFKNMKPNAYFINVARGKSVVTDDLLVALRNGHLAGTGLDVTDPEPLPADHPLWQQPRVIITPHVAYRSEKLRQRVMLLAQENLRRYVKGEKLLSVVNVKRGY